MRIGSTKISIKKRVLLFTLKIIITAVVMLILIKHVDLNRIRSAILNPAEPRFLLFAVILLIPNLMLQLYRWHYLLRLAQSDVKPVESVSSLFGGMVVGIITPGRIGELGRSLFLKDIDRLGALGLVFIDKMYSVIMIFLGGLWGLYGYFCHVSGYAPFIVWPMGIAILFLTVLGVTVLLHPEWVRALMYQVTLLLPYRDKMKRVIGCMDLFQGKHARTFLLLSFSMYLVFIIQFCLFAFAFEDIPFMRALFSTTATIFAKTLIPISFADLGIREGAAVFFFSQFNLDIVTAFNSSILLFSTNVLIPTIIGLLFLPRLGINKT